MKEIFGDINYLAVFAAGIAYWLVGMLWFSLIFGKIWSYEVQKHGIKIKKPSTQDMIIKSILTFIFNLLVSFALSIFIMAFGISSWQPALVLGLILGIFFTGTGMAISYVWESRSLKLSLIDIGYPILGIIIASIILALWK